MSLERWPIGINLSDKLKTFEIIGKVHVMRPPPLLILLPALSDFKDDVIVPIFVPTF